MGHGEGWKDRVRWILAGVAVGAVIMGAAAAVTFALVDDPSPDKTLEAAATATTTSDGTTEPDGTGGKGTNTQPSAAPKPGGKGTSGSGTSGQSGGANAG